MTQRLTIAIVVGEVSGDSLGAQLMRDLKARGINADFVGIGGPQMLAEGFYSLYPMERLAVMGLVEVLKHLKSLFAVRDGLLDYFNQHAIDIFIGIDAPDFNLRVSKQIKAQKLAIKTVQYVSPSVWAWRQKRVVAIREAVDLVLCLFPFEVEFYQQHQVPARFVGHPLAQQIALDSPLLPAKQQLQLDLTQHYLAVLPGSRRSEITRLLPEMLHAIKRLHEARPEIGYLIPAINESCAEVIQHTINHFAKAHPKAAHAIQILYNDGTQPHLGRTVMQAADAVLLASGTATLEALLLHRPMVVVYKLHWLTYRIAARLIKIPYYSLPNILAKKPIVAELIQSRMTARGMSQAVLAIWQSEQAATQRLQLTALHRQLQNDGQYNNAAAALLDFFKLQGDEN